MRSPKILSPSGEPFGYLGIGFMYSRSSHDQAEAVEKNEPENISPLRTQRHADANLASLQEDGVAHHTENSDDYQD